MSTPQFKSAKSTPSSTPLSTPAPTSKSSGSFKVENESSPYAFEPEPLEISGPYRKKSEKSSEKSSKKSETHSEKPEKSETKKDKKGSKKPSLDDFNLKDIDSSISLPPELASQLAAQAQNDKNEGKTKETTYFIPLQKDSGGQSFGVAVKLGTEGPPGPDQKVIMKAKLVTQPVGKPLGATVIKPASKKPTKKSSQAKDQKSSSSESESSSEESSEDEKRTKKAKKITKKVTPPKAKKPKLSPKPKEATIVQLPVTSPTISSRSQETSLGIVENLDKFPKLGQHAHLCEAPIFKPTEAEFKDPIKYIQGNESEF